MFICGSGSLSTQIQDELDEGYASPCRTPKRSKRTTSFCRLIGRDASNKNPYADRGLDKFYALLADLDNKKQKIYTQMAPEEISFVRFVYTNDSDHVKPIVVKVKDPKKQLAQAPPTLAVKSPVNANRTAAAVAEQAGVETGEGENKKKKRVLRYNASFKLGDLRRPYVYFPVIIVLILVFLAIYGRSFAILCTSIGWYMVPSVVGGSSSSSSGSSSERKLKRKKELVRKQSEKKIVQSVGPSSPTSVINGHGRRSF